MTQELAIDMALDYVIAQRLSVVLEPCGVRRMQAERFNRLLGCLEYPSDFWVVEFLKLLSPGVAAESPGCVMVEVVDATQRVREIFVGMFGDTF